jgi:uncharacterized protein (TIGR02996 family)
VHNESLAAAILADPTDQPTREAYADWLEDHGDPRAGCVRLATRLRGRYGPRRHDHAPGLWQELGRALEPGWWVEEALGLVREIDDYAGHGGKTAVLIALALVEATLLRPRGLEGADAGGLRQAAEQAAAAIQRLVVQASQQTRSGAVC